MFVWEVGDLNNEQIAAINAMGNVFLVACPGSGKTRTLSYKLAVELSKLDDNKRWVVAITYTHRAADEIRERIENLGVDTSQLWIGTIHSFCLEWILKPYGLYHAKLKNGFRIINSYDSEILISEICANDFSRKVKYNDCNHFYTSLGMVMTGVQRNRALAEQVLVKYHDALELNCQIDFEQILYFSYEILSGNKEIARLVSRLFSYVLVDEYQDTKEIQYNILAMLIKGSEGNLKAFVVGDPNQAIYGSLGGYAITKQELENLTGVEFLPMSLNKNYRSSSKIVDYYSNFNVIPRETFAEGEFREYDSIITYETNVNVERLVEQISRYIEHSIQALNVNENEICVLAPQWVHLAEITRQLVSRLPQYSFDGPGLVPFSRDIDNFWFKLSQIILTEPSPSLYVKRLRWASNVIHDMTFAQVDVGSMSNKELLRIINSIKIDEVDGLAYLRLFFRVLFLELGIDFAQYPMLREHYDAFFNSAENRIARLRDGNAEFAADIDAFRKAFKPKTGIKVSTIHGVKGGEFDVVISFGLLNGFVPNFNDQSIESSKKLLYVIGSRARKNLHLISEKGRTFYDKERNPTEVLYQLPYRYDDLLL